MYFYTLNALPDVRPSETEDSEDKCYGLWLETGRGLKGYPTACAVVTYIHTYVKNICIVPRISSH